MESDDGQGAAALHISLHKLRRGGWLVLVTSAWLMREDPSHLLRGNGAATSKESCPGPPLAATYLLDEVQGFTIYICIKPLKACYLEGSPCLMYAYSITLIYRTGTLLSTI